MIKLRNFINTDIIRLDLAEANAGYSSLKIHGDIALKLYNAFVALLTSVPKELQELKIEDIPASKYDFDYQLNKGEQIQLHITNSDLVDFDASLRIDVLLAFIDANSNIAIAGAAVNVNSNPIEIYLKINKSTTVKDVVSQTDYIEQICSHEATHIIKFIQKLNQLSMKSSEDFSTKDKNWWYKYYVDSSEQ